MNILFLIDPAIFVSKNINNNTTQEDIEKALPNDVSATFGGDGLSNQDLAKFDIVVGYQRGVFERILQQPNSKLKFVQSLSAGVDYYPMADMAKKHIKLATASGIHAEPITETVFGVLLSIVRWIQPAIKNQLKAEWNQPPMTLMTLVGHKILIYGTGHIGQRIAEIASAFKMDVVGVNHNGHPVSGFNKTIAMGNIGSDKDADVIVNALPLTPKTKGIFDKYFFHKFTNHPIFMTIGRGPSTVTLDLISALQDKTLSAAGIDVTDPEPLPSDSPLWKMDNVVITPHISGFYGYYLRDVMKIFYKNLASFSKDGHVEINQVNLESGY